MLAHLFKQLDQWINEENIHALSSGLIQIGRCEFKVVGQSSLLEADLNLSIAATGDLDAFVSTKREVIVKLNEILRSVGMVYDELSDQIWMPDETQYVAIYKGEWVTAVRALPEYVFVSKARYAMERNRILLVQYLASNPHHLFFELCKKYQVNLDVI